MSVSEEGRVFRSRWALALFSVGMLAGCPATDADKSVDETDVVPSDTGADSDLAAPVVTVGPEAPTTGDDLVAVVQTPDPAVTYVWRWVVDGAPRNDLTTPTVPASQTAKGQRWQVEVRASEGPRLSEVATASVTIVNTPPVATVAITPADPTAAEPLIAQAEGTDADGDELTFRYAWRLDGSTAVRSSTERLEAAAINAGETWVVEVVPLDGETEGAPVTAQATVRNAPPFVRDGVVTLTPAQPLTGTALQVAFAVIDPDGSGTTDAEVAWFVGGVEVARGAARSLAASAFNKGDAVFALVTPTDGTDTGEPVQSNTVLIGNTPPFALSSTLTPAEPTVADVLTCAGTGYSDADPDDLAACTDLVSGEILPSCWRTRWYAGGALIAGETDTTLAAPAFARGQVITCEAVPFDGVAEGTGTVSSGVTVRNAPPVIDGVTLSPTTPAIDGTITATVSGARDPDGDVVVRRWQWYVEGDRRGSEIANTANSVTLSGPFRAGDRVRIDVTPSDGPATGATVSDEVVVANTLPRVLSLEIGPTPLYSDVNAVADATWVDDDGNPVTITYTWRVGTQTVQSGSSNVLDASFFGVGDSLVVTALPNDGRADGAPRVSDAVVVANRPPRVEGVAVQPAAPAASDTLDCTYAATVDDDPGDTVTVDYDWRIGGVQLGIVAASLPPGVVARGDTVACGVRPFDQTSFGARVWSPDVVIVNAPPTIAGVTLSTVDPEPGETISAAAVDPVDPDGDPVFFRTRWEVNGVTVSSQPLLTPDLYGSGDSFQAFITPTDNTDDGVEVASPLGQGRNANPRITRAELLPEQPGTGDDLVLSWDASDADPDDVITSTITWYYNDQLVPDITDETFPAARTTKGGLVRVVLRVEDGRGGVDTVEIPNRLIENTLPTVSSATVVVDGVGVATVESVLTCEAGGWSDLDGDSPAYLYRWLVDDVEVGAGQTLSAPFFAKGDSVRCEVRPTDGDERGPGPAVLSDPVVVLNARPSLAAASITPDVVTEGTVLSVVVEGATDPDGPGDTLTPRVTWRRGTTVVGTDPTLDGTVFDKGDSIRAVVVVEDTEGLQSAPVTTAPVTVVNTPPVVSAVSIAPEEAFVTTPLVASYTVTDPDPADTPTLSFEWTVNGGPVILDGVTDTLPAGVATKGQSVVVSVQADDGDGGLSEAVASLPRVIRNTPPTGNTPTISPATVRKGDSPTCVVSGFADPDPGDVAAWRYTWRVDGTSRATTASLSPALFSKGQTLVCEAAPFDGQEEGIRAASAPVVVQNSTPTLAGVAMSPAEIREGTSVTALALDAADRDGNTGLITTYTWFVNGSEVTPSDPAGRLTSDLFDKGDVITVTARVTDDEGAFAEQTSLPRTVVNSTPVLSPVSISPTLAYTTSELSAVYTLTDADPADQDSLSVSATWEIEFAPFSPWTDPTLPAGTARRGQRVRVTLVGTDGTAFTAPRASPVLTIENSAPRLDGATVAPLPTATERDTLTCTAVGLVDDDPDDEPRVSYRWLVDGTFVSASSVLTGTFFNRGDEVVCQLIPTDNSMQGASVDSEAVTIVNALPALVGVNLTASELKRNVPVSAAPVGLVDPDPADTPSSVTRWYVNGGATPVQEGTTLFPGTYVRGDTVVACITPSDPFGEGEAVCSDPVPVVNAAPVLDGPPSITPNQLRTNDRAFASVVATDVDGDPITLFWTWEVNGVPVPGVTGTVLDGAQHFDRGDSVRVTVYAEDSEGATTAPRTSTGVPVVDTPPSVPTVTWSAGYPTDVFPGVVSCSVIAGGHDPDGDDVQFQWEILKNNVVNVQGGVSGGFGVIQFDTSVFDKDDFSCRAYAFTNTPFETSAWSIRTIANAADPVFPTCEDRAAAGLPSGILNLDHDGLEQTPAFDMLCDTNVARSGGGWVRVLRTTDADVDFGQRTFDLVSLFQDEASSPSGSAVFEAFIRHDSFSEVMLVQSSGGQSGQWRRFALPEPATLSLYDMLRACRDELPVPDDDTVFDGVQTTGHTARYSATAVDGTLRYVDASGTFRDLEYFSVCGVNRSADNDVSYLAFHTEPLDANSYGDSWRGQAQVGTIWSFANGNYADSLDTHIGGRGLETLAGWKGSSAVSQQGLFLDGDYEIFVR